MHHKRKRIYIAVLSISNMALRENTPRTEVLAISPGLSHLINAAKGNPNRRTGNKNWSKDGLFGIKQALK